MVIRRSFTLLCVGAAVIWAAAAETGTPAQCAGMTTPSSSFAGTQ